jgi:hypothetical protein
MFIVIMILATLLVVLWHWAGKALSLIELIFGEKKWFKENFHKRFLFHVMLIWGIPLPVLIYLVGRM